MTQQNKNVPKLRFPEFSGEWDEYKLGKITQKVGSGSTPKGGREVYQNTGIPFIRSQNVNHNKLICNDLTYIPETTHEKMKGSKVLPSDILLNITGASIGRSCVVPSTFLEGNVNQHVCIIRTIKGFQPKFIQSILSSYNGQKLIMQSQAGGGREGLNFENVRGFKLQLPKELEQQKIAEFLSAVDERVDGLRRKKELLEQYKKGVMQKIFSQEIRFTRPDGTAYPDWESKLLGSYLIEHKTRNLKQLYSEVFSVAKERGVVNQIEHLGRSYASEDISNYKVAFPDDIIYTKSPTSDFPYGIIKQNKTNRTGVVSVLYGVFKPQNKYIGQLLHAYFLSSVKTYNYLHPLVNKGAKNTMNINNNDFMKGALLALPVDSDEQKIVADFLSSVDEKIKTTALQLEEAQKFKKALLQQMFV